MSSDKSNSNKSSLNLSAIMMSLSAFFVGICAIVAAYGYKGRVTIIGVDLGTTFSVVGINRNNKIEIITDDLGRKIFPSVVSYLYNFTKIEVGYDALPYLTKNPKNTIYNSKRFIGRTLDDINTNIFASKHPFELITLTN